MKTDETFEPLTLIHAAVCGEHGKGKELARMLGMPYSTLMRQANPADRGAKLGLDLFCRIMRATGDYRPLECLAGLCGFALIPKTPAEPR